MNSIKKVTLFLILLSVSNGQDINLPSSINDLEKIGVSKYTRDNYGEAIINIINKFMFFVYSKSQFLIV